MKLYFNDIPENGEELTEEELIEILNDENDDHKFFEELREAKVEAQICCVGAWAVYDEPIYTYCIDFELNDNEVIINEFCKVGETGVDKDDEESMPSKESILDSFNLYDLKEEVENERKAKI